MSLTSIVREIERRAKGREIGHLQEIRKELHGFQRLPGYSIFHPDSIKEKDGYAFHYGGRKELQFNIGYEGNMFRHGVGFSFEPSQTLPKIELLIPSVERFNEFLMLYPQQYSDLPMWHWQKRVVRSSDHPPTPIVPDLIRRDNFVFMGRLQPSESIDCGLIVDDFDRLFPLSRFVEGAKTFPEISEPKNGGFRFEGGCTPKPFSTTAPVVQREIDVRLRHNEIEVALHRHLASIYGDERLHPRGPCATSGVFILARSAARRQTCNCRRTSA